MAARHHRSGPLPYPRACSAQLITQIPAFIQRDTLSGNVLPKQIIQMLFCGAVIMERIVPLTVELYYDGPPKYLFLSLPAYIQTSYISGIWVLAINRDRIRAMML